MAAKPKTAAGTASRRVKRLRQRNYECRYCEKKWPSQAHRARHERTHTREQPFGCHLCSSRFNQRSNLYVHLRSKHDLHDVSQLRFQHTTSSDSEANRDECNVSEPSSSSGSPLFQPLAMPLQVPPHSATQTPLPLLAPVLPPNLMMVGPTLPLPMMALLMQQQMMAAVLQQYAGKPLASMQRSPTL
eukprot:m.2873 g.2873  ORF g.2873 m.2873 type:complete len:187 (-) comp4150_c0_seq1:84-644(-)